MPGRNKAVRNRHSLPAPVSGKKVSQNDGSLNREDMVALILAMNPRVKFSDKEINAILDEVFRTYSEFIDVSNGLLITRFTSLFLDQCVSK